jgi:hypothetical protein
LLGPSIPEDIEFASSTLIGSFSTSALSELKSYTEWADASLWAGNFGHSSETAILLEKLLRLPGIILIGADSFENFASPEVLLKRADTCLVLSFSQLQKMIKQVKFDKVLKSDTGINQAVEFAKDLTLTYQCNIIFDFLSFLIVSVNGQVITTRIENLDTDWALKYSAASAVWWLQNPSKPLEALSTAVTQFI